MGRGGVGSEGAWSGGRGFVSGNPRQIKQFHTPRYTVEQCAADLKGSAHSADPLEKHGVVWWCIAGFERFSVSSDPYLDFRLPLAHIRGVIYSMLHNSASGPEIGHWGSVK